MYIHIARRGLKRHLTAAHKNKIKERRPCFASVCVITAGSIKMAQYCSSSILYLQQSKAAMKLHLKQSAIKFFFASIAATCIQTNSYAVDSASFEVATGNKTQMVRIGTQWNWADKWWQSNNSHIGGYWDLTLAQWRGTRYQNRPDTTQNITDIGITPIFRFQRDNKTGPYAEAGIGAHLLSHTYDNNGRALSTAFQFGDHIGIGYVFFNKLDLGLKIQHFSNGGIKHPNNGVNFAVLSAKMAF